MCSRSAGCSAVLGRSEQAEQPRHILRRDGGRFRARVEIDEHTFQVVTDMRSNQFQRLKCRSFAR